MIVRKLRWWRGVLRLRHGYCPLCNSSPPRKSCPVCLGDCKYGYEADSSKRLVWRERFSQVNQGIDIR